MVINILCVLLLFTAIHPITMQYSDKRKADQFGLRYKGMEEFEKRNYRVYVTFIYEFNKQTQSPELENLADRIGEAVLVINELLDYDSPRFTYIKIEDILMFNNSGKPLAKYTAAELSRLLKNDAFFKKYLTNADSTQIVANGDFSAKSYPEELSRWDARLGNLLGVKSNVKSKSDHVINIESETENKKKIKKKILKKILKKKQNQQIAAATFKNICSKRSRGIIIDRQGSAFNIGKVLTYNLACDVGIYDKRACLRGFRENDMECVHTEDLRKEVDSFTDAHLSMAKHFNYFDLSEPKYCFLEKVGLKTIENWKKTKKLCERNRKIRQRPSTKKSRMHMENEIPTEDETDEDDNVVDDDDDESSTKKFVYILLAISGGLLIVAALVGICLWKINRDKTKKLTKDRVSVNYKYDVMKRNDTPSIINDPRVTNDLE